jgi:RimJ/RimL family protein N-acetyltransferase
VATSRILEAKRLRLEPFSEEFLTARYVGWLNDPEVVRFSERRHQTHSVESAREYLRSFDGTPHYFWAIIAAHEAAHLGHIGNISAHVDLRNSLADVSILIGERGVWGRGFGFDAWMAACRFLLDGLGLRKVTAGTLATNTGMLEIMKRAGMQDDGRRLRHYLVEGREVDVVHMALFRQEP